MSEIQLGDKVRCKISGFTGTATARMEFLNGCIQYEVAPRIGKENKIPDTVFIDEQSLEVVLAKKKKKIKKEKTVDPEGDYGGPNHPGIKLRGY